MSYDLTVFAAPRAMTPEEASEAWIELCEEGDSTDFPEEPKALRAFVADLSARWKPLDQVSEGEDCPWAFGPFTLTDVHVELNIQWSRAEEVRPVVVALATDHGLSVYDQQEDRLDQPPGLPTTAPGR